MTAYRNAYELMEDYYECDDCGRPPYKKCRQCGIAKLCRKCYNILDGLCVVCRNELINGKRRLHSKTPR